MKKQSIIRLAFMFVFFGLLINGFAQSPTITISKKASDDPDNVCNGSISEYTATVTNVSVSYSVTWNPTNGSIDGNSTSAGAKIKWNASSSTDGYKGKLLAVLTVGTSNYNSNEIKVTIKSIKDQTATIAVGPPTPWNLSPCESGTLSLEAGNMWVPGTGTIAEKVNAFAWQVPSGWSVNGQPSIGTNWITSSQNVSVIYPKSNTGGSIKVKASYLVNCGGLQESKESTVVTVNRSVSFAIAANKSSVLCGDVSPVTFSVSPALPCALYYWNNSQTATTSNSYQITPNGSSDIIASVYIVYGTSNITLSKTLKYQLFPTGITPKIIGSTYLCSGNSTYTVSDLRPGYSVSWILSPKLQQISIVDNTITLGFISSGSGTIKANVSTACGIYPVTIQQDVWMGLPTVPLDIFGIQDGWEFWSETYNDFTVNSAYVQNADQYNWVVRGGTIFAGQGTKTITYKTAKVPAGAQKTFDVSVKAHNTCGWGPYLMRSGYVNPPPVSAMFVIYPNPATSEVTVSVSDATSMISKSATEDFEIKTLDIIDFYGNRLKAEKYGKGQKSASVNVSGFQKGTYFVIVNSGSTEEKHTLVVK